LKQKERLIEIADFLDLHKDAILKKWMAKTKMSNILVKYRIDSSAFKKSVAIHIVDYFIDSLRGKQQIGQCPIMNRFIDFMFEKKVKIDEIYLLCMGFRYSLFSYRSVYDKNDTDILNEIFDLNLAGVLKYFAEKIMQSNLQQQLEKDLNNHITRLQTVLDLQENIIFKFKNDNIYLANQALFKATGVSSLEEFVHKYPDIWGFIENVNSFEELFRRKNYGQWLDRIIEKREGRCEVSLFDHFLNRSAVMQMRVERLPNGQNEYIAVFHDITEQRKEVQTLSQMIYTDTLTGVPNRRKLVEMFAGYLDRDEKKEKQFFLIVVDIHDLARINEISGRNTGDIVLKSFAESMMQKLNDHTFFSRIDGDRFAILLDSCTLGKAREFAKSTLAQLHFIHYSENAYVKGNIAIVSFQESDDVKTMMQRADRLIRTIKKKGGDAFMDDTLILEEEKKIKEAQANFFHTCQLYAKERKPLEIVNYYMEVPIQSEGKILKVNENSFWVQIRKIGAHVLCRNCEVYVKMEEKKHFICKIKKM